MARIKTIPTFKVVRINSKRKELLTKLSAAKDVPEQNKILQNSIYPNRLKKYDSENDTTTS